MAINNFIPFAVSSGANVTSQDDYEALAALSTGFSSGKASSAQINKALRQGTVIASAIAQFIADNSGNDVLDDGSTETIIENFLLALQTYNSGAFLLKSNNLSEIATAGNTAIALNNLGITALLDKKSPIDSPILTGNPKAPTPTQASNDNSVATTAFVRTLAATQTAPKNTASLGQSGWWKCADTGFIKQWGTVTVTSNPGQNASAGATFPIAFPNACVNVSPTRWVDAAGDTAADGGIQLVSISKTGFVANLQEYNNTSISGLRGYSWMAIGY